MKLAWAARKTSHDATCSHQHTTQTHVQAVELAKRLVLEWGAWVCRANALRRAFVSVKGIYFQVGGGTAAGPCSHCFGVVLALVALCLVGLCQWLLDNHCTIYEPGSKAPLRSPLLTPPHFLP